ncbi:relaxase/mobilization nuclease domain-containing protein [Rufibacter sp. XAAS-G3-1]|uniref:relaxase/mobilization nuclease domain-containing protein n=1 Tax=Rufibacter sp. XAAS-G3-1 TaxID=2729134 RepID=UPI0015E68114|nr:relaxase/mobilization nuclease domain-containing protein [Rufibacter sp. XAAS-G3-1]
MVVKILSNSASFNGVGYNEEKVDRGSAELVSIKNFGIYEGLSGVTVQDYKEYLTQYSNGSDEKASRVKNPQFHAVISCEGREYDTKQLTEIAEQYLDEMGYGGNPFLIYFHSDTANNHVHIVSSRVNDQGKKINDSFEGRRSQAVIQKILGADLAYEVKSHVDKAMRYNFSSEAQFKMLLEAQGVTVKMKDDSYKFIKNDTVLHQEAKTKVGAKIEQYKEPEKRAKQLAHIFQKYKPALGLEEFSDLMKSNFGVELVFHKAQGKDTPYGYTIVDHAKKQVFKGSQVMKLAALLSAIPRADRLKAGGELITLLAQDEKLGYRNFKGQLSKLGFDLDSKGEIKLKGEEQVSFSISKDRMKQVHYSDRFSEAQKFRFSSKTESEIIAKIFSVNKHDLEPLDYGHYDTEHSREQERQIISDKLNSLLDAGKDLGEIAKDNNYSYAKKEGEAYLVDKGGYAIYNMAYLTDKELDYSKAKVHDLDREYSPHEHQELEQSSGGFSQMLDIVEYMLQANSRGTEADNKRKRKINQ